MKTIAIYCAGRNELPPPGIKGIQYFPDRACMWDKLAEQYPDTLLRIYFNLPGEFIVDMWPDIFRESDLVSYIPLDEDASVEDIAERIAADQPDLAIAFSIPILPYDWSALRDAMVGEELRRKGIKTIAHNIRTASHALEKDRCSDYLCQNGFFVAKSLSVRNTLFQAHKINTAIPVNVYREYVLRVIREMHFPVIIKPTVFSASDRLHVASDIEEAVKTLDSWPSDSDFLIEEQIIGTNFGIEIYGTPGNYHVMEPVMFSAARNGVPDPYEVVKAGPVLADYYRIRHLKKEIMRLAELYELNGTAQVDLIFSEGEWYIIEINARHSLMTEISAQIERKTSLDIYGALAVCDIRGADIPDTLQFACDFKTPYLKDDTIRQMMKLYPCIASVMSLQTAVSTDGKVEYCEFVVTAETAEKLMEAMICLKEGTENIVSDKTIAGLNSILNEM